MLKFLRNKKTAKKIWIGLAVLVLPAFVLWGSGSIVRNKQEAALAGKIFGKKVPILEFQESLAAVRNQALIQLGDKFAEVENTLDLRQQAWERLILLKAAQQRKIKITDSEVISAIQSYPFFQDNGAFDQRIYSQMLTYVFRSQPRAFEEQIRQNLTIAKLFREVTAKVNLDDKEILEEYKKTNQALSIYYIAGLPADFRHEITPDEAQLRAYFEKNSLQFKQPLTFNVEYAQIADEGKSDAVKEQVKKIYSRLKKKEPFELVAKENSLTLKETGLFNETGPIPGIGWSPQVMNLISESKPNSYLMPLYIDKSYYILRIKERKEPYIPAFENIKDKIKEAFIQERAKIIAKEKIDSCLEALQKDYKAGPKSVDFDKTAKIFGLKNGSTDPFKYDSYIEGIGASDIFWTAALKLKDDEFSGVIEMPGGFYIIKLKTIVPFDEKQFEAQKAEFSKKLLAQKKQEYFVKFLAGLKKQTQKGF